MKSNVVVGSPSGIPDLKIYNVIIYHSFAEDAAVKPLLLQHEEGFSSPMEALINLHECLKILNKNVLGHEYQKEEEYWDLVNLILSISKAESLDGLDAWEELMESGWNTTGRLVTGLCVTVLENGEKILADEKEIEKHVKLFEKKIKPEDVGYQTTSLRLEIITVSEIS